MHPKIFITPGEPAGIGPDIVIQLAQQSWPADIITVCDPLLLESRAKLLKLPLHIKPFGTKDLLSSDAEKPTVKNIEIPLKVPAIPGELNPKNAAYVLECLKVATATVLKTPNSALVTGPVHKGVINQAGFPFKGHTEFLAEECQVKESLMLFVTESFKVALATTHLPLKKVSAAITQEKLISQLTLLHQELQLRFHIRNPRIIVSGLNPHAGERGYLGKEEIDILIPAMNQLRDKMTLIGPLPADTLFNPAQLKNADAILAMYHDQALPVVKYARYGKF
jgi:4-hydroxythreonine-4-phosphate dehydrogenase